MNLKSAPATILLGIVGLVLVTALGWLALIGPAVGAIGEAGDARTEAADRNDAMSLQLAKVRKQAEGLPETRELAGRLDSMFPPTADQPGFFAQVKDAAAQAGLAPAAITTLDLGVPIPVGSEEEVAAPAEAETEADAEPAVGDSAAQEVSIVAEGTDLELSELLANLESMERAFLVNQVQFGVDDTGTKLTLTVTGITFVAPPLGEAPRGDR